ncbi:hypothetical protein [Sphingosinicella sp. BN140058]|uniref:hypothetical protein n=1 Tax=Sphingosinicella sp. BN140058 TaxID=1892855 RepID=UPI00101168AB|nr:hypothetical protein [Sphingosinicella sp. BN140058]QAY78357.1 hypothetical protein ETR14_18815 [Sphingosinicella sp. BN140058]
MRGAGRPLTPGEIDLCRRVFPDPLPYRAVRLCDGAGRNPVAGMAFRNRATAIALRRTIYFRIHYRSDFAWDAKDHEARRLFLHEMTHVWQWWVLGVPLFLLRYGRELKACRFDASAMYRYADDPRPFGKCRLEAQAEMIGDYQRPEQRSSIAARLSGTGFYGL